MTTKELFISVITKGIKAVECVSSPEKQGAIYAEIGKAIAMSGLIEQEDIDLNKDSLKESVNKTTIKEIKKEVDEIEKTEKKVKKEDTKKKEDSKKKDEPKKEEVKNEEPEDEECTEWNDKTIEEKTEQIEELQNFKTKYGEETILACIESFSQGVLTSEEDINPSNIDAFVDFLRLCESQM